MATDANAAPTLTRAQAEKADGRPLSRRMKWRARQPSTSGSTLARKPLEGRRHSMTSPSIFRGSEDGNDLLVLGDVAETPQPRLLPARPGIA